MDEGRCQALGSLRTSSLVSGHAKLPMRDSHHGMGFALFPEAIGPWQENAQSAGMFYSH
jgi:hypothetical protein